jgi:hypothetical protein
MDTITATQSISIPLVNSVIVPILVSLSTTLILLLGWWLRKRWQVKHDAKIETQTRERDVFTRMLDNHSRQFASISVNQNHTEHRFEDNLVVTKELLIWSSDEVLAEYSLYMQEKSPEVIGQLEKSEIHFGRSILAFRKQLGYKSKDITPEQVALVFKAAWRGGHI